MIQYSKEDIKRKQFLFNDKNSLNMKIYLLFFLILINFIVNNYILISIFKSLQNLNINIISKKDKKVANFENQNSVVIKNESFGQLKSNIDPKYEFFQIKTVNEQIKKKNLTYIETLSGGFGNVGNALIMLNNWINICEKIRCKNIIAPGGGLKGVIKKPIFYKEYNITILPNTYKDKIKVDINLNYFEIFYFRSKNPLKQRLRIIRDEVFSNIPKYNASPNDLYINIRSGDIFLKAINSKYGQPPLCFYQKIINKNKYENIFIISNGHENPVVDELLKLYPKIKYLHGSVEYDISIIVNAYNFVIPFSTFSYSLIYLNNNLKNLYIYNDNFIPRHCNYTIHKMEASQKYKETILGKWNNTKEQLILMLNESCKYNNFTSFDIIKY